MKRNLLSRLFELPPLNLLIKRAEIDGITYRLNRMMLTAQVSATSRPMSHCSVPPTVTHNGKRYTVTAITEKAFWRCDTLSSVEIADTVTEIGEAAFFSCQNLKSVRLPSMVEYIGPYAFRYCELIDEIYYESAEPVATDDRVFETATYSRATLLVDPAAQAKIMETSPWMYFNKITAAGAAGKD